MQIIQKIENADRALRTADNRDKLYQATSLYGEIDLRSFANLIHRIPLTSDDTFIDLGSGTGKPTLYTHLALPVAQSLGLEWDSLRYQYANQLKLALGIETPLFHQVDFFTYDLNAVTCLYVDATASTMSQILRISQQLDLLPKLHTVISLRPLIQFKKLPFIQRQRVCCSWDFQMAYLYSNRLKQRYW